MLIYNHENIWKGSFFSLIYIFKHNSIYMFIDFVFLAESLLIKNRAASSRSGFRKQLVRRGGRWQDLRIWAPRFGKLFQQGPAEEST